MKKWFLFLVIFGLGYGIGYGIGSWRSVDSPASKEADFQSYLNQVDSERSPSSIEGAEKAQKNCEPEIVHNYIPIEMQIAQPKGRNYDREASDLFYEESKEVWENDIEYVFEDQFGAGSDELDIYHTLREDYKLTLDSFYKQRKKNPNEHNEKSDLNKRLYREKVSLELIMSFHKRLKERVGEEAYALIQDKIDECRDHNETAWERGEYWRYCSNF